MPRSIAHLALLLVFITAVGPFAIDGYLQALPTLGASLHTSLAAMQMLIGIAPSAVVALFTTLWTLPRLPPHLAGISS